MVCKTLGGAAVAVLLLLGCGSSSGDDDQNMSKGVMTPTTLPPIPGGIQPMSIRGMTPVPTMEPVVAPPPPAAPGGMTAGPPPPVTTPPPPPAMPMAGGAAPPPVTDPGPVQMGNGMPKIPAMKDACPNIATGNIMVMGKSVQLWVGQKQAGKKGPILFYWHGTGSSSLEAAGGMGTGNQEILDQGGVIASFTDTLATGMNTGNNVWYTGDFEMADQILACAIQMQDVDPFRVYTAGCSAGGLQSGAMVYGRSSYLAAAMPNSGGTVFPFTMDDPSHVPALITTHGAMGVDVVGIEFTTTSLNETMDIAKKGGFAVDCDHGGSHCGSPAAVKNAQWKFLKDHPFGVMPEPYAAGLPADFPTFCKIIM
jgi:hypothetical protein